MPYDTVFRHNPFSVSDALEVYEDDHGAYVTRRQAERAAQMQRKLRASGFNPYGYIAQPRLDPNGLFYTNDFPYKTDNDAVDAGVNEISRMKRLGHVYGPYDLIVTAPPKRKRGGRNLLRKIRQVRVSNPYAGHGPFRRELGADAWNQFFKENLKRIRPSGVPYHGIDHVRVAHLRDELGLAPGEAAVRYAGRGRNPRKRRWIGKAIKRPGALRAKFSRWYGLKKGQKISPSMYSRGYARARKRGDTRTMRQINLARRLAKMRRRKISRKGRVIRGVSFRPAARRRVANPRRKRGKNGRFVKSRKRRRSRRRNCRR